MDINKALRLIISASGGEQVKTHLSDIGACVDRLNSQMGIFGKAWGTFFATDKLVAGIKAGISAVDDFQMSVAKTAAMITSLQGGNNISEHYRKAKEYAEGLNGVLQQVDAKTTLNLANLQVITEEMVKQGVVLDYTSQSQVEGFTRLANAAAVYSNNGRNEVQLRQEVAALLRGEVDQNSQLASMIQRTVQGPLRDQVEQWKQSGTLVEELGKRLSGFGPAAEDIGKSWSAVKSSLETSVNLILRAGFGGIVKDLVGWLDQLNNYLKDHKDLVGKQISDAWKSVKSVIETVGSAFKLAYDNAEPMIVLFVGGAFLKGVAGLIAKFTELRSIILGVRAALIATGAVAGAANGAGAATAGGGVLSAIGGGLAGSVAAIAG